VPAPAASPLGIPQIPAAPLSGASNVAPPDPPAPQTPSGGSSQPSFFSDYTYYLKNPSQMGTGFYYASVVAWCPGPARFDNR
jgi:hypothetical protein